VIGIGRGFDWMHTPTWRLLINPYSPDLADPIRNAAGIIGPTCNPAVSPMMAFCCSPNRPTTKSEADRARAELKSIFLSRICRWDIRAEFPT